MVIGFRHRALIFALSLAATLVAVGGEPRAGAQTRGSAIGAGHAGPDPYDQAPPSGFPTPPAPMPPPISAPPPATLPPAPTPPAVVVLPPALVAPPPNPA